MLNTGGDCWDEGASEVEVDVARVWRGVRDETIRMFFCWTTMLILPSCPEDEWRCYMKPLRSIESGEEQSRMTGPLLYAVLDRS